VKRQDGRLKSWMGQMRADQMIDGDLDSAIGLYLFRTIRACDN